MSSRRPQYNPFVVLLHVGSLYNAQAVRVARKEKKKITTKQKCIFASVEIFDAPQHIITISDGMKNKEIKSSR